MIPVNQTRHGIGGNCFAACVASILEKPLDFIDPLILGSDDDWLVPLNDFLRCDGISLVFLEAKDGVMPIRSSIPFYCIISVVTNNGIQHAVVGKIECEGGENILTMEHDPEPESSGIKDVSGVFMFVKSF